MLTLDQIYIGALVRFTDYNNDLYYNKLAVITAVNEIQGATHVGSVFIIAVQFHGMHHSFKNENPIYYEAVDP